MDMKRTCYIVWALAGLVMACNPSFEVYDLTCEGLAEPLAIDSAQPHFSWKIASGEATVQTAYQIQLSLSPSLLKHS